MNCPSVKIRASIKQHSILRITLNTTIHCTIGHKDITYDYLVDLFKPQYEWLTSSKLCKYVSTSRRLLLVTILVFLLLSQVLGYHVFQMTLQNIQTNPRTTLFLQVKQVFSRIHSKAPNFSTKNNATNTWPIHCRGSIPTTQYHQLTQTTTTKTIHLQNNTFTTCQTKHNDYHTNNLVKRSPTDLEKIDQGHTSSEIIFSAYNSKIDVMKQKSRCMLALH